VAVNAIVYLGLFGSAYTGGVAVVWIFAGAMLVASGCGTVDMVLAMGGRTRWNLCNVLAALSTMVIVDLVLVPRFGAAGAAVGLAAAVCVNNLAPLVQIFRTLGVHPFGPATRRAAALSAGTCGVPPLLVAALGGGSAVLMAASAAGLISFLAGAHALRHSLNLHLLKGTR
jgi:O-antigen/teichoic acid export membrane protein